MGILHTIFPSYSQRQVKRYRKTVEKINALEPVIQALTDEALAQKTSEFQSRLEKGETMEQIMPEAFAVVREASRRTLGQRHYRGS